MATPTLEQLRLLLAVASRGTIAGAAEDAGYTASAVSQQLSALERQLGTSLLERSNRGVTLTPAGARLGERASLILDLVQTATIEATQAGAHSVPITLRIGAFPTAISGLIVPAIALLEPLVHLAIVHTEPQQALADLAARHLDAALVDFYDMLPEPAQPGLRQVNLLTDPLHIAVRADRTAPRAVPDLACVPWVLGGTRSRLGRASRIALRAAGLEPAVLVESDDHWVTFDVMSTVDAATVLPDLALRNAPGHVRSVTEIDLGCDRDVHLVTRNVPHPHPGFTMLEKTLRVIAAR